MTSYASFARPFDFRKSVLVTVEAISGGNGTGKDLIKGLFRSSSFDATLSFCGIKSSVAANAAST